MFPLCCDCFVVMCDPIVPSRSSVTINMSPFSEFPLFWIGRYSRYAFDMRCRNPLFPRLSKPVLLIPFPRSLLIDYWSGVIDRAKCVTRHLTAPMLISMLVQWPCYVHCVPNAC